MPWLTISSFRLASVLGSQSRRFKQIFALAQDRLCNVFGLELRELPAKEVYTQAAKRKALKASATQGSGSGGTSTQAPGSTQSAAASAATGAGAGTGQYVLVSCLARPFRVPPIIVPPASASAGASPSAGSRGGAVASTQAGGTGGDGSTLHEDSAAFVAFYTVVIALLYLNNGSGTLAWLRRQLMPLGCHESVAAAGGEKTDVVLARLARLGYLVRVVDKDTAGGGGGAGGDAPGIEDETVNFFIGPRGKVEVGPEGVARLVRKVWRVGGGGRHGGTRLRPGEVDEDLEKRLRASLNLPAAGGAEGGDASGGTQAVPEEA